jgi:hypothetical protein
MNEERCHELVIRIAMACEEYDGTIMEVLVALDIAKQTLLKSLQEDMDIPFDA